MPLRGFVCLGLGVGIICSLWRDGFRIGCRHLIVSHARKTLARSRAAGICDTRDRGRACDAQSQTVYLYLTPRGEGGGPARERPCVTAGAPRALPVFPLGAAPDLLPHARARAAPCRREDT